MSIGLNNMTLQQCLCAGGQIARQLTTSLNTTMLVIACQSAEGIVECVNFTCPCNQRRALSVLSAVCQTIYRAPAQISFQVSQVEAALVNIAHVTDMQVIALPVQQLVWDNQLVTWQPDSFVAMSTGLVAFLTCAAIVVVAVILWLCYPVTNTVVVVVQPNRLFSSAIRVKIM